MAAQRATQIPGIPKIVKTCDSPCVKSELRPPPESPKKNRSWSSALTWVSADEAEFGCLSSPAALRSLVSANMISFGLKILSPLAVSGQGNRVSHPLQTSIPAVFLTVHYNPLLPTSPATRYYWRVEAVPFLFYAKRWHRPRVGQCAHAPQILCGLVYVLRDMPVFFIFTQYISPPPWEFYKTPQLPRFICCHPVLPQEYHPNNIPLTALSAVHPLWHPSTIPTVIGFTLLVSANIEGRCRHSNLPIRTLTFPPQCRP